jgi:hypothetical protein
VLAVRALGQEAAVVQLRARAAGAFEGTSFTDDYRCVMVCEKQGGEWRLVLEQCTLFGK